MTRALIVALTCFAALAGQPPRKHPTHDEMFAMAKRLEERDLGVTLCDVTRFPGDKRNRGDMILAAFDSSGRLFCNDIKLLTLESVPHVAFSFNAAPGSIDDAGGALESMIVDVNHDGDVDLVVPDEWAWVGSRADCHPTWITVYQCTAQTCADASRSFTPFYERELVRLNREIAKRFDACRVMERDKIRRWLGSDRHAGFATAERWMRNGDRILRERAVAIFADIADAASRLRLESMTRDRDRNVAGAAKNALERLDR